MAALTYNELQATLLSALRQAPPPYNVVPPDFTQQVSLVIRYAENRIHRDLVLLNTREQNVTLTTTAGARSLDISTITPPIIVLEGLSLLTPTGSTLVDGVRQPFDETSLDVIDMLWPDQSVTMDPSAATWIGRRWAMLDSSIVVISPTPDGAYHVVATGMFQPAVISATNQTTYLSTYYPELLFEACMVAFEGWLTRNFGSQASNPQEAQSHEVQYQVLKASALVEELRRRGLAPDIATPQRAA